MSIITKSGDKGSTGLMFNRRVSKTDPRLEAYGTVDELNAALGLARASCTDKFGRRMLVALQQDLVVLMGELATRKEDLRRYLKAGHTVVTRRMAGRIERLARKLESKVNAPDGWATPGDTLHSAALDLARAVCRRAERRVCALGEAGELDNQHVLIYLNRLGDLLWLMARRAESQAARVEDGE
jgi:cob(I)alamin adenosyltransferase